MFELDERRARQKESKAGGHTGRWFPTQSFCSGRPKKELPRGHLDASGYSGRTASVMTKKKSGVKRVHFMIPDDSISRVGAPQGLMQDTF